MSANPRTTKNSRDPLGRRASKTHTTQETTTTHRYLYDDQNIVAILNEEQELLATILHHPDKTDTPLSITNHQTNQTYYYHRDHQGSIIALTNEAGQIVEQIEYDGHFGEIMEHTRHEITHNPYGYTGREMDTPRLYYYRARYYSPILRRFLSPDPIEHASGDYNWYRYVGNDPVNRVDPLGLFWPQIIGAIIGAGVELYQHGLSWDVAVAAATGALGGFGSNLIKSAAYGAVSSGLNTAYKQAAAPCKKLNGKAILKSMAYGASGGAFGGALGGIGKNIKDYSKATPTITNIAYPVIKWSGPIGDYSKVGAAIGAVGGGAVSNSEGLIEGSSTQLESNVAQKPYPKVITPIECSDPCKAPDKCSNACKMGAGSGAGGGGAGSW